MRWMRNRHSLSAMIRGTSPSMMKTVNLAALHLMTAQVVVNRSTRMKECRHIRTWCPPWWSTEGLYHQGLTLQCLFPQWWQPFRVKDSHQIGNWMSRLFREQSWENSLSLSWSTTSQKKTSILISTSVSSHTVMLERERERERESESVLERVLRQVLVFSQLLQHLRWMGITMYQSQ